MARPKILLSLDASWWNRLGFSRLTYHRMIRRSGGRPRSIGYRDLLKIEDSDSYSTALDRLLEGAHGLLLSGGGDIGDPSEAALPFLRDVNLDRDRFESALLAKADDLGLPVLGVCRGAQLLNIHHGGSNRSLRRDPRLLKFHRLSRHPISLVPQSHLWQLVPEAKGRLSVSSYHAHAVDQCGEGLRPAAFAPDGVVEAIEAEASDTWRMGIQWHPEWMPWSRDQRRILNAFCTAAGHRSGA